MTGDDLRGRALEAVLAQAPIAVFAFRPDGTCTVSDGAALRTLGLEPGELVGQDLFALYADDPLALESYRRVLAGERFRTSHVRPDGRAFDTDWVPLLDGDTVVAGVGVSVEVTDRVVAETELDRFRALVETAPDFIAIAALDGTVQYVNPGGRRMVGMPDDVDVATTSISDYLTAEGLVRSLEVEQPAVVATGSYEGETTLRHWPSGVGIPVRVSSFLVRDFVTGEPTGLATVHADITEIIAGREATERALTHQRGLLLHVNEAYEAERQRIAGELHDDTVQVMAAVNLRLSALRHRLTGEGSPGDVVEAVARLDDSVREANTRLRSTLFQLDPPPVADAGLAPLLTQLAEQVLPADVVTEVSVELAEPPSELAGRMLLRIAREALTNVAKHAAATRVEITVSASDEGPVLRVRDDGVGLGASDAMGRGTHLGLRSMADRAQAAGGTLEVLDGAGGGTVVEARLPERLGFPGAGEALPDLQHFLEQTLETIPEAYVAVDRDWRFVHVSRAAYHLLRRDPTRPLVGKVMWEEFDVAPEFATAYRRAMERRVPVEVRAHFAPWDVWMENRILPTGSGLSIFARDVTDDVRTAEEATVARHLIATGRAVVVALTDEPELDVALDRFARLVRDGWGVRRLRLLVPPGQPGVAPLDRCWGDDDLSDQPDVFPLRAGGRVLGELHVTAARVPLEPDLARLVALRLLGA